MTNPRRRPCCSRQTPVRIGRLSTPRQHAEPLERRALRQRRKSNDKQDGEGPVHEQGGSFLSACRARLFSVVGRQRDARQCRRPSGTWRVAPLRRLRRATNIRRRKKRFLLAFFFFFFGPRIPRRSCRPRAPPAASEPEPAGYSRRSKSVAQNAAPPKMVLVDRRTHGLYTLASSHRCPLTRKPTSG